MFLLQSVVTGIDTQLTPVIPGYDSLKPDMWAAIDEEISLAECDAIYRFVVRSSLQGKHVNKQGKHVNITKGRIAPLPSISYCLLYATVRVDGKFVFETCCCIYFD